MKGNFVFSKFQCPNLVTGDTQFSHISNVMLIIPNLIYIHIYEKLSSGDFFKSLPINIA